MYYLFSKSIGESWKREYIKLTAESIKTEDRTALASFTSQYALDMNDEIEKIEIYGEVGEFVEVDPRTDVPTRIKFSSFDTLVIKFKSQKWLYISHFFRGLFEFSKRMNVAPSEYLPMDEYQLVLLKSY